MTVRVVRWRSFTVSTAARHAPRSQARNRHPRRIFNHKLRVTRPPDARDDEDPIKAVIAATTDAFSRHDAKAWVKFCTSEAQLVTVRGESMNGVAEIEKGSDDDLPDQRPQRHAQDAGRDGEIHLTRRGSRPRHQSTEWPGQS